MNTAKQKSKVLSIRVGNDLYERIESARKDGESLGATGKRLLEAGLSSSKQIDKTEEIKALELAVTTLSEQLKRQGDQLSTSLEQNTQLIKALTGAQDVAQASLAVQGINKRSQPQLETTEKTKKRGLWSRFKNTFKDDS